MPTSFAGPAGQHAAPRPTDRAKHGIIAANAITIVVAYLDGAGLLLLLWPYWIQSVVIGFYAQRRMRLLQRFSTEGLKINNRSVDPTLETRSKAANFFVLHYGFFHLGYLVFLISFTTGADGAGMLEVTNSDSGRASLVAIGTLGAIDLLIVVALGVGFWQSHRASHLEHVAADLRGRPNLGALMFMPYARIIPMHLTIILGAVVGAGGGVVVFGVLKTVADVIMHKVEHHVLQQTAGATG